MVLQNEQSDESKRAPVVSLFDQHYTTVGGQKLRNDVDLLHGKITLCTKRFGAPLKGQSTHPDANYISADQPK